MDRAKLRKAITDHFTIDELKTLCFDLHIEYENLDGETRQAKVRELVSYCERTGLMASLLDAVQAMRPNLDLAGMAGDEPELPVSEQEQQAERDGLSGLVVPRPVNLSFDTFTKGLWPSGWYNSYGFVPGVSVDYRAQVVARPAGGEGSCVVFWHPQAKGNQFGSLMQRCPARHLAGKAVRLEGEIMTEDVEKWCGLWLRADGELVPDLVFDNMGRRPVRGTTSWKQYAIEAPLPEETVWLNYGIILAGPGTMWADKFRITVWTGSGQWTDI